MPKYPIRQTTKNRPVLIITKSDDLIFGIYESRDDSRRAIRLSQARVVLGGRERTKTETCLFATHGPSSSVEVSDFVPSIEICRVNCIIEVTESAAAAWDAHRNE